MKKEQMAGSREDRMRLTHGCRGEKGEVELLEMPWEANQKSTSFVLSGQSYLKGGA